MNFGWVVGKVLLPVSVHLMLCCPEMQNYKSFYFATVMLLFVDKEASGRRAVEWGLDLCVMVCS